MRNYIVTIILASAMTIGVVVISKKAQAQNASPRSNLAIIFSLVTHLGAEKHSMKE